MKRTKLSDRKLPDYTRGEEIMNTVTHIVGGGFGIIALLACLIRSALKGDPFAITASAIYGVCMILLYTMSSIYHGLHPNLAKKVFQVMDHCTIYLLIAGTYTPILVCGMAKEFPLAAWLTFGAVWGLAILATVLTAIDIAKYKVFSMICYVGMGWAVIFSIRQAFASLGVWGFSLVLGGGILYTLGVIFFKIGKTKKYFHSIFHIMVLLGSICHALAVMFYVLWRV